MFVEVGVELGLCLQLHLNDQNNINQSIGGEY